MKNFTNNFKQFTSRLSARWLLIAFMFLLGTGGAWGATVTFTSDDVLFFNMKAVSWWTAGTNGNGNFAYFYNNSTNKNAWSAHAVLYSGDVYYVKIPAGTWEGVILTRNNTSTAPSWDNKWNQTGDISLSSTSNYISKFSENSTSATWGTQKPTSTGKLTASSTTVSTNTEVTLTPSLTSYTTYNEIKSTTYAISPSTGASISGNTFTATAAGTYTVTATITYNPRGYSSLTSTVTATTTITVEDPCPDSVDPGTASGTKSICSGGNAIVALTGYTEDATIQWQKSTTSSTSGFANINEATSASYTANNLTQTTYFRAVVTLSKNDCDPITDNSGVVTITVNSLPVAPTLNPNTDEVCSGVEFTLPGDYNWYEVSTGGTKLNSATISGGITSNKSYWAEAKNASGCVSSTRTEYTVTVNDKPTKPTIKADKTITNGTVSLMSGESVTFSVTQVAGETYTWYRDNNNTVHTGTTYTTNVNGSYTVKATNSCGDSDLSSAVTVSVCESINGLYWEIDDEDEKDIYCPGDKVDVTLTYNGSAATDYAWGGDNGGISKPSGTITSGSTYQFTLNNTGNINMTLTGCDSETATTKTLYFTVATAPAAPQLLPSGTINVGQNKSTTITVDNMDANATYVCYKGNTQVGTWNGNSVTFNVGDATGNFTYSIVATNKTCGDLTAETEFTVKVEEAGVKIAALGSTVLYTNDLTHFIPMYVSNEDLAGVGATSVKKYTWQFSANGTSGWTDCTRNYGNFNAANNQSNGNVVVTNGSKNCNNWRANQEGYYRCKLTYDNDKEQVSGNIQVTGTTNSKTYKQHIGITYNLPIISVNTGANSFPSDAGLATKSSNCGSSKYPSIHADKMKEKISVDVMMFNPDRTICYDRKARMNYRGSSSLNFKKKSYAFVTGKEKTKNLDGDVDTGKANLFGLSNGAEDKDWVLYAATPDPSMMRNRLVFDLYQKMRPGEWGVNSMYVELVVNGEYRGVYVLMDKITCNANRVNIKNENGFIVKFDKTDVVDRVENTDGDQKTFATSRTGTKNSSNGIESYGSCIDQRFEIEYPEKEDIELWDAFYGNVQQRFENFETALANKDYATVRTLIDYDSWADWFIITELAKNQDGFRASCIFVYDGDKIEARPLWDQELSFNNGTRVKHGIDNPDGLIITTSSVYSDAFYPPFWFTGNKGTNVTGGLLNDPCFVSLVKQKWATYQSGVCSAASIGDMVADYNTELGNAINREAARWPYTEAARGTTTDGDYIGYYNFTGNNPEGNSSTASSFAASKNAITAWIADRSTALTASSGLGKAINALNGEALIFTLSPSSVETTPWQQVMITVNAPDGYEYTFDDSSINNATVKATVKKSNDTYAIKIPRPSAWGVGGNGNPGTQTQYQVSATIEVSGENQCGTIQNGTATSTITLTDVTENCNPEIVKP